MMPAAELTLWARVEDLSAEEVQNALWRQRSLIKTWVMRGVQFIEMLEKHEKLC